jgi:hypothetical protein
MATPKSQTPVPSGDLGQLLSTSFNLLLAQIGPYILISLIVLIPVGLVCMLAMAFGLLGGGLLTGQPNLDTLVGMATGVGLIVSVIGLIGQALMAGALIHAANSQASGGKVSVGEAYKASLAKAGTLIIVILVVGIAVCVGSILLVLPGLAAFFFFCLTPMAVMLDNDGVGQALGRSVKLALKIPVEIIVIGVITFVLSFIFAFIPFIGALASCVIMPWAFIALTLAYKKAQEAAPAA